jgi:hypothetical protein
MKHGDVLYLSSIYGLVITPNSLASTLHSFIITVKQKYCKTLITLMKHDEVLYLSFCLPFNDCIFFSLKVFDI